MSKTKNTICKHCGENFVNRKFFNLHTKNCVKDASGKKVTTFAKNRMALSKSGKYPDITMYLRIGGSMHIIDYREFEDLLEIFSKMQGKMNKLSELAKAYGLNPVGALTGRIRSNYDLQMMGQQVLRRQILSQPSPVGSPTIHPDIMIMTNTNHE